MKIKTVLTAIAVVSAFTFTATANAEDMKMSGDQMSMANMGEVTPDPAKMETGVTLGDLVLYDAFTRAMPPTARAGGGFVTIVNTGMNDDRLVSAASPAAEAVQLHTMKMDNGVMVMRELENGVELPAGKAVALKPGGMHIMFIDAVAPFAEGETVDVTLSFEKAGEVTLHLPVGALGSKEMPAMH